MKLELSKALDPYTDGAWLNELTKLNPGSLGLLWLEKFLRAHINLDGFSGYKILHISSISLPKHASEPGKVISLGVHMYNICATKTTDQRWTFPE